MNVPKSIMQTISRVALAFAVCLLTLTPAFALTNGAHQPLTENLASVSLNPAGEMKNCWIDYNVTEAGRRGMRIHVNFEVTGLKGIDSKLVARVQQENEDFLTSNSSFSNENGELETSFSMKPGFPTTVYEDAEMFLPYSEINLRKGTWDLKLDVDLNYEDGELIQHLGFKHFKFTSPNYAEDVPEKPSASATVNRVWVDYDVFQNRKKGMMIHVNFEVTGLKGIDSKLVARVVNESDEFLAGSSAYSNKNGELEVAFEMKPGFPTTVYKDATIFLPYDAIILRKGIWNLKLDLDLNYGDGELIDHLTFYEFEFTR